MEVGGKGNCAQKFIERLPLFFCSIVGEVSSVHENITIGNRRSCVSVVRVRQTHKSNSLCVHATDTVEKDIGCLTVAMKIWV